MENKQTGVKTPEAGESARKKADTPSLAVALGSSGTRAFAALPFLQRLDREGLKPDLVIGSGGGGLMAALWSAGYNLDQIVSIFTRHFTREAYESLNSGDMSALISEQPCGGGRGCRGLYTPKQLRKAYQVIFKDMQLEDLVPRTLLYATDVERGEGVCLETGSIATAVEACGAYYPVMPPVQREGLLLANGGFVSPLPIMEAVKRGAELILAVYLEETAPFAPRNFLESAMAVNRVTSRALRRSQIFGAINVHDYEICIAQVDYSRPVLPWDVEHIPEILLQGKIAAQQKIPELLRLYRDYSRRSSGGDFIYHSGDQHQRGASQATQDAGAVAGRGNTAKG